MAKTKLVKRKGKAPPEELPSDMEDEVEKFHKRRDKLSLNVSDDELSEDELGLDEEGVFDISDGEDGGSDDEELDSDEEEDSDTKLGRRECWGLQPLLKHFPLVAELLIACNGSC